MTGATGEPDRQRSDVPDRGSHVFVILLCGGSRDKAVTTADRCDLQVQACMFWMTTVIQYLQVGLVAGQDAYQSICLPVLFTEVST